MSVELKVTRKFQNLLTPLTDAEEEQLRTSIANEGVRDPIVIWKGQIVDGHNRHRIATQLGKEVLTREKDFKNEREAREWIIKNQLARRNLPRAEWRKLVGALYNSRKQSNKERASKGGKAKVATNGKPCQKQKKENTAAEIAKEVGCSEKTVRNCGQEDEGKKKPTEEKPATRKARPKKAHTQRELTPDEQCLDALRRALENMSYAFDELSDRYGSINGAIEKVEGLMDVFVKIDGFVAENLIQAVKKEDEK